MTAVPTATAAAARRTATAELCHTFVIPALPSARTTELERTQNSLSNTELRTTGFYLPADTALNLVVHQGSLLPILVVGAPEALAESVEVEVDGLHCIIRMAGGHEEEVVMDGGGTTAAAGPTA
jgi:hypothetical protein